MNIVLSDRHKGYQFLILGIFRKMTSFDDEGADIDYVLANPPTPQSLY
jgi:hypothetical protein